MIPRLALALACGAAACALAGGCGGGPLGADSTGAAGGAGTGTGSGTGVPLVFTVAPVDPAVTDFILPLGNLNPPDHTIPSDHIYFYVGFTRPENRHVPVVAPAGGRVQAVLRGVPDSKILVEVSAAEQYYLDHVILDGGIQAGTVLVAGQALGTSGNAFGIDLGVINRRRALTFANPARYPDQTIYADAPLRYYAEPVRGQLYAMVRREGIGLDGRIDYDIPGRLQGNWFLDGLPVSRSAEVSAGPSELAFVFDNVRPSEAVVSSGGLLGITGPFKIHAGATPFAEVSKDSGVVAYRLAQTGGTFGIGSPQIVGTLLVEMVAGDRIRVELILGAAVVPPVLGSGARTYVR